MYKRNQVEWAIWQTLDRGRLTADEPPTSVVNTLRRLIDVDRKLSVNTKVRESWRHRFAFIQGLPQGRGGENHYRLEETVLLWLAVQYQAMGFPQTDTIRFLRVVKPELEREIRRLFAAERERITRALNERGTTARALRTRILLPNDSHVHLISASISPEAIGVDGAPLEFHHICRGPAETTDRTKACLRSEGRAVLLEIANPTLTLAYFLMLSPLMKRGRAGSSGGD